MPFFLPSFIPAAREDRPRRGCGPATLSHHPSTPPVITHCAVISSPCPAFLPCLALQHEKIIRGVAVSLALIQYGREEEAEGMIEQMTSELVGGSCCSSLPGLRVVIMLWSGCVHAVIMLWSGGAVARLPLCTLSSTPQPYRGSPLISGLSLLLAQGPILLLGCRAWLCQAAVARQAYNRFCPPPPAPGPHPALRRHVCHRPGLLRHLQQRGHPEAAALCCVG